ncbi:MAG: glycerol-3-phosphate 1-O-acyltransferase PlsY [Clostridia bacterium]|nr:glycerol-3-phosphate 1-O-acyltransferase PlsY [Clostridia bacterium]
MLRMLPSQWILVYQFGALWGVENEQAMLLSAAGILLCAVIGYLLGSLNSAIIISHVFLRRDIRAHGSGNAGTTNMLRTYGTKYAVMTMVFDMLKGIVATALGFAVFAMNGAAIAGFFCVLGHMFPIYYRFKGGKGVATTAMVALMLDPWTFLVMLFVFVAIILMTRFVSLASVMCAFLYPLLLNAFFPAPYKVEGVLIPTGKGLVVLMGLLTTAFVVFMHRENIKRLWNGKESKVSFSRKKKDGEAS